MTVCAKMLRSTKNYFSELRIFIHRAESFTIHDFSKQATLYAKEIVLMPGNVSAQLLPLRSVSDLKAP